MKNKHKKLNTKTKRRETTKKTIQPTSHSAHLSLSPSPLHLKKAFQAPSNITARKKAQSYTDSNANMSILPTKARIPPKKAKTLPRQSRLPPAAPHTGLYPPKNRSDFASGPITRPFFLTKTTCPRTRSVAGLSQTGTTQKTRKQKPARSRSKSSTHQQKSLRKNVIQT